MKTDAPKEEDIKKIKEFLEEKDLRYDILNDNTIVVPYEIAGKLFKPSVEIHGKWLVVNALIVGSEDIPSKDDAYTLDLYRKLLLAVHELPEINFDVDEAGSIYTSVDMRLEITDFNNFFSEFFAVPYGVKYFIEKIAPSMDPPIEVKGFPEEG
ncbi:MAG: hypothetical protein ACFFCS_06865 [Candidatus Hodarchaeota archaeon]